MTSFKLYFNRKIQRRHTWSEKDNTQFLKKKPSSDFLKVLSELNSDDDDDETVEKIDKIEPRKRSWLKLVSALSIVDTDKLSVIRDYKTFSRNLEKKSSV